MAETVGGVSEKLDKLEVRVRAMESAITTLDTSVKTSVGLVKWLLGSSIAALLISLVAGVGGFFWTFFEMRSNVAVQSKEIVHLEKQHKEGFERIEKKLTDSTLSQSTQDRELSKEMAKHGRDIGRLEGIVESLVKENKKLASLIERSRVNLASIKVMHGEMLSAKGDTITFMVLATKAISMHNLSKDTVVTINNKDATIADLYPLRNVPAHIYFIPDDDPYSVSASLLKIEIEAGRKGK
jgi:hypothetical protein